NTSTEDNTSTEEEFYINHRLLPFAIQEGNVYAINLFLDVGSIAGEEDIKRLLICPESLRIMPDEELGKELQSDEEVVKQFDGIQKERVETISLLAPFVYINKMEFIMRCLDGQIASNTGGQTNRTTWSPNCKSV